MYKCTVRTVTIRGKIIIITNKLLQINYKLHKKRKQQRTNSSHIARVIKIVIKINKNKKIFNYNNMMKYIAPNISFTSMAKTTY